MLHLHFGTGRLGLGLVVPFFQRPGSELHLLDRAASGDNPTGATALTPDRRNGLLRDHPHREYFIQKPAGGPSDRHAVHYDDFVAYGEDDIDGIVGSIARNSQGRRSGAVVTASILKPENYVPVIKALNCLGRIKQDDAGSTGGIFLAACENTLSAGEVFEDRQLGPLIAPEAREHVTCVPALVDRLCVGLEEDDSTPHPTVLARAEEYGALKLQLSQATEPLMDLCRGNRVEFGRHIDVEKRIKGWPVNGRHWIIALTAFQEEHDPELKLNEYLAASPEHFEFATAALEEMGEGIALLLRRDPEYAAFLRDVDIDLYLERSRKAILARLAGTEDSMTRILARFRAPTRTDPHSVEDFARRFADRIDAPIDAFRREHSHKPRSASRSLFDLHRLIASGSFINTVGRHHR